MAGPPGDVGLWESLEWGTPRVGLQALAALWPGQGLPLQFLFLLWDLGAQQQKVVQAMGPRAVAGQVDAQQLQELWSRTERAERRLLACENLVGELRSNLAALGSLLQDYGQLQQRLDNVENLLKNRNFWILRLPPGSRGEIPKVTVSSLAPGSTC